MTIQSITYFYVSMNRQFFIEILPFSTYSSNILYAQLLHFIWEFLKTLYVCLLLYGDLYIVVTVWWWAVVEKVIVLPLLDLEYYMKSKKSNCNSSYILNGNSLKQLHACLLLQCSLVKPPPSVQSVVWRYNEFGDKLRDIENRKLCDHMKR